MKIILLIIIISVIFSGNAYALTFDGKEIEKTEYINIKIKLINKISLNQKMTFREIKQYIEIANREIKLCRIRLFNVNKDNLIAKLNVELIKCSL